MKILQINSCNFGSTGNIMLEIAELATLENNKCCICVPMQRSNCIRKIPDQIFIGDRISRNIHLNVSKLTGFNGCFSYIATKLFIKRIDDFNPDIIHFHNLHNCYLNIYELFRYIKKKKIPVVWTLHDCWPFTGHCPHFTLVKCDKWKTGCFNCPQYKEYPKSLIDNSKFMWKLKKKWFTGVKNMTIVTPSEWLAGLVKESYLKDYHVKVINNGIDLNVFRPTPSDFRRKHGITQNKYIVLGVSFGWGIKKGLDVFVELSKRLDDEKYQIVLVGTNEKTDEQLPNNIISIHCTQNKMELAEIYSAANLFVNPTREENFPTVNIESLACGTPVLTFMTGGSPEIIDETCGSVVDCEDIDSMEREIKRICIEGPYSRESCLKRAKNFDKDRNFQEYVNLYEELNESKQSY